MTLLAFDKATVRSIDKDGRLHVALSNITKASVDPYYGHEIPGARKLGLDPNRVYWLLRDPEEIEKAAPTFNNLPILREHVPVTSRAPQQELVIGSTGTDAAWSDPYLQNSAVVWCQDDIDDIDGEAKCQWSCAYHYTPEMTSGVFRGLRYDGIMRNIIGNHVALVEEGRAGDDVVVGDSQIKGSSMKINSRVALMLHGALVAHAAPLLAQDAKIDLTGALKGVTAANLTARKTTVANSVVKALTGKLAQDEGMDVSDVVQLIEAVQGSATSEVVEDDDLNDMNDDPNDKTAADADDDAVAKIMAFLDGKLSDEDMAELGSIVSGGAMDADGDDDGDDDDKKDKPAMDAAAIRKSVMREQSAIRQAERDVRPIIGEVTGAVETAADVYKLALDHRGVDLKGVPKAAYRAMVGMLPANTDAKPMAFDRKAAATAQASFNERFPDAAPLIVS